MSLTLKLGKEFSGKELADVVEASMKQLQDYKFRRLPGRYTREVYGCL